MDTNAGNAQVAEENAIPKEGMQFTSVVEAFEFYNSYAKVVGFGTRKSSVKRHLDGVIYSQQFLCYKAGNHSEKKKASEVASSSSSAAERHRGIVRTNCKAKMAIYKRKESVLYQVTQFVECHNHELATPRKSHLLNSHRHVSKVKKALIQNLADANVPTSQQFGLLEIEAGGFQNIGCTERDLRNELRDQRKEHDGNDAATLFEEFSLQKEENPLFYFSFDKDEEGRMSRCFWADAKSRVAYAFFGDVVVFDTTYNTNKYSMICAPLVGINQHKQTILFGCGFLSDETTDSFDWFFQQFLQSMLKGPPQLIITDQDPAMAKSIAKFLPETTHRYCIWHIMNKFSEKLGPLKCQQYYKLFQTSVYNSDTREEFEISWQIALQQSSLQDHGWLRQMYDIRERWVPAYLNHIFSAGCSSSQRVESSHAFLKNFVSKRHSLMDFMTHFKRALKYQREQELYEDWSNINEKPKLRTVFLMEIQMAEIYSKNIFLKFQEELYQCNAYIHTSTSVEDVYVVVRAGVDSSKPRRLVYDMNSDFLRCTCRLFEFQGFPCRHMLHLFHFFQVVHLPEQYIMNRWTKNAKVGELWDNINDDVSNVSSKSILLRRAQLSQYFSPALDDAVLSDKGIEKAKEKCDELVSELKELNLTHIHSSALTRRSLPVQVGMSDPKHTRAKGCGRRLKSGKEKAVSKGRLCRGCGRRDQSHDKRNCPMLIGRDNINSNYDSSDSSD